MSKNFSLGRGLSSLIPSGAGKADLGEQIKRISPEKIQENPLQPRKAFKHRDIEDLINSIKEHGILQPLIVTKLGEDEYELIAGERRLRSAKILELEKVPVIVREAKDVEKLELSLIENIQRKDLNPIERAVAYQKLLDEFNFTQKKLAQRIGKNRATVANTLRLLSLPEEIQQALTKDKITEGHAKIILSSENSVQRMKIFRKILLGKLSVRQTESAIRNKKTRKQKDKNLAIEVLEEKLRGVLGTRVEIKGEIKRGKIIIEFYSKEELDNIIDKIC